MASTPAPLSELIKINDQNLSDVDGISDLLQDAPLLAALQADFSSNGTQHKYLKETKAPVVGFRTVNQGRDHDHSSDTVVSLDLQILDATFHVDQAYADEYKRGRDAWLAREGERSLRAAFSKAESQVLYGTGAQGDAAGFTGLADAETIDSLADEMVVDAGGSGAVTSVYLIRSVAPLTDVMLVTGNEGNVSIGDVYQQLVDDGTGKYFNAYVTPIYSWLGLQIGSAFSVGRIANITAANPLNDDLISEAISKFPATRPPTHLAMNRTALQQLQASRTATNPTGAPAPFPQSSFNVPIVTSDHVRDDETALT